MLSEVDGLWIWALALAAALTVAVTALIPSEEAAPDGMVYQDSYTGSGEPLAHTDRALALGDELSLRGLGAEVRQTTECREIAKGCVWAGIPEAASRASGLQTLALPCPQVRFDRSWYVPGDTARLTVTDPRYTGQPKISGTSVLVVKHNGVVLESWDEIPAVAGTDDEFRVGFTIPEVMGILTVLYTDPADPERTEQRIVPWPPWLRLTDVTGISFTLADGVLRDQLEIRIDTVPEGAVADRLTFVIYAPRGATLVKVHEWTGQNTNSYTWSGGNYGSGPYLVVAMVESPTAMDRWTLREWMYIWR